MWISISCIYVILDVILNMIISWFISKVLAFKVIDITAAKFMFQFPYCDGSHSAHNEETGDNVGPICILRKKK